jgi:hypothetical protein
MGAFDRAARLRRNSSLTLASFRWVLLWVGRWRYSTTTRPWSWPFAASSSEAGRARPRSDLVGGSTFSFQIWPEHPYYEEATRFLATFRAEGSALRKSAPWPMGLDDPTQANVYGNLLYDVAVDAGGNILGLGDFGSTELELLWVGNATCGG